MPTIHLLIKGKVQGVYYRASARDKALELGLHGWVKNTREGDVELTATGSDEQLAQLISWCKTGPRQAEVISVTVSPLLPQDFDGFRIQR